MISELFPLEVRGQAVALAVQANFASNMLVALVFPVARDALRHVVGEAWAMSTLFAVFAAIAIYALEFVRARVPETKGLSLEEIEWYFASGDWWRRRRTSASGNFNTTYSSCATSKISSYRKPNSVHCRFLAQCTWNSVASTSFSRQHLHR